MTKVATIKLIVTGGTDNIRYFLTKNAATSEMLGIVVKNSPSPVPTIAPMMMNKIKMSVFLLLLKRVPPIVSFILLHILLRLAKSCPQYPARQTENEQTNRSADLLAKSVMY